MLFYLSLFSFFLLMVLGLIHYRALIIPRLPPRIQSLLPRLPYPFSHPSNAGYSRVPTTFAAQASRGLSSSAFDLEANLAGDSRMGLDEAGTQEVLEIMNSQGVSFDEARLIRHHKILASNGIDPSGMPLDSKAVTRL